MEMKDPEMTRPGLFPRVTAPTREDPRHVPEGKSPAAADRARRLVGASAYSEIVASVLHPDTCRIRALHFPFHAEATAAIADIERVAPAVVPDGGNANSPETLRR